MKIVFLDVKTIGEDIDLSAFDALGEVVKYDFSTPKEVRERTKDADVIVLNKVEINEASIGEAKNLKLVCVTATGTNNLDKEYLAEKGIAWRNVAGYSTETVAQHTFAMLFYLMEHLPYYDTYVKEEHYIGDTSFTHFAMPFHELAGKTWGIIGLGNIGKRVADIAKAFGCKVIYYSTSGKNSNPDYNQVSFEELLERADIVSVHAPLNEDTRGLMNKAAFARMKSSAIFLNVGRGPIVVEADLEEALREGQIAAAGLDVLAVEPMSPENPLRKIKDSGKLLITPHIAWASVEARTRLMEIIVGQIKEYFFVPKAVIFDLDGTLLDTLEDLKNAVNAALRAYQLPERTLEEVRRFVGNGIRRLMIQAVPEGEAHPEFEGIMEYFRTYYKEHCTEYTAPYAGVDYILQTLKDKGIPMGIVSNKFDPGVKALREEHFGEYIQTAIGELPEVRRKPEPDMVYKALEEMGIKVEEAIYIGDSEVDIQTAKNAGLPCICVTWGFRDRELLVQHGATKLADTPEELLALLNL